MGGTHIKSMDGFIKPADIDVQLQKRVMDRKLDVRSKRDQWLPGTFIHPHDACFDRHGNIFVSEYVLGGRVTKLRKV